MDVASGSSGSGAEPYCGNGIVEAGELCDAGGESATCNDDCTDVLCGDGLINEAAGEECEGTELEGATCEGMGFYGGEMACRRECSYDRSGCFNEPGVPVLALGFSPVKQFNFSWDPALGAEYYQLLESPARGKPLEAIGEEMIAGESVSMSMPLHFRFEASYVLRACNRVGCTDSEPVDVLGAITDAVGYAKASNADSKDNFGVSVALSDDGSTLAVGAYHESGGATGINDDNTGSSIHEAGAVYVFVRDRKGTWSQQAYVKASNPDESDIFGLHVALSDDGSTLAVSARWERSNARGIDGDETNNSAVWSGAVYVFIRDDMDQWSQQAYVKASNTDSYDYFGQCVALSGDGSTLAVGADRESSDAIGINGEDMNNLRYRSGAVYVFVRDDMDQWSQQAYVKASNPDASDEFGHSVALSDDGSTLAVGARWEDSSARGIGGDQENDTEINSGAVYVFVRDDMGQWSQQTYVKASNTEASDEFGHRVALSDDGGTLAVGAYKEANGAGAVYLYVRNEKDAWSHQAYIKASNAAEGDQFGHSVALSDDGRILAVGADREDSGATGIGGNEADISKPDAGAVYVFVRDGQDVWSQEAYVKAPNTDEGDQFGYAVALRGDGSTVAVGAVREDGSAIGVGGDQNDDDEGNAGAVYLY
ncbi:MAG: integrin [Myxococcota bacterium]